MTSKRNYNGYDEFEEYRTYLRAMRSSSIEDASNDIANSVEELKNTASYQVDATRNGESQPIIVTRKSTNKCNVTLSRGDEMYIGDLIYVFDEYWLCMELYVDEYGIGYAELWMCNQIFNFQNFNGEIISKYAIIDDGSYSKASDTKSIVVTDNAYTCYISLDDESASLYVDKRMAIGKILNSKGEEALEVGKIGWIDARTLNFGEGSHLMQLRLRGDVFNPETDDIDLLICDYVTESDDSVHDPVGCLSIDGRASIKIGTTRTYRVVAVSNDGSENEIDSVEWEVLATDNIKVTPDGCACNIEVPLSDDLIGEIIKLTCRDLSGNYSDGNKTVVVMSVG